MGIPERNKATARRLAKIKLKLQKHDTCSFSKEDVEFLLNELEEMININKKLFHRHPFVQESTFRWLENRREK
ncbi:hypothetical protein CUU64_03245 [Bacillus sp. V5-8f]|nr:hypothetical protein CUU64_03245 [Bacillus sp. V5-8f]